MPTIDLYLDGDNAWPDLRGDGPLADKVIHLPDAVWQLAAVPRGMASGRPSLALRIDLPDGRVLVAETSLGAWIMATASLRGRFPESFEHAGFSR